MALKLLTKLKGWYLYWRADAAFAKLEKTKHVEDGLRWYKAELAFQKAKGMVAVRGTDSQGRTIQAVRPKHYRLFAETYRMDRLGVVELKPLDLQDSNRDGTSEKGNT